MIVRCYLSSSSWWIPWSSDWCIYMYNSVLLIRVQWTFEEEYWIFWCQHPSPVKMLHLCMMFVIFSMLSFAKMEYPQSKDIVVLVFSESQENTERWRWCWKDDWIQQYVVVMKLYWMKTVKICTSGKKEVLMTWCASEVVEVDCFSLSFSLWLWQRTCGCMVDHNNEH